MLHTDAADLLEGLTATELLVLARVALFETRHQIAGELEMSYRTVQNHRSHVCQKLNLKGSHQLVSFATEKASLINAKQ